jgi:photosynthetic reaction center cytochrome c subunit
LNKQSRVTFRAGLAAIGGGAIALLLAGSITVVNAHSEQSAETTSGSAVKTAAEQYKNIRVMKDIPADQLMPAMQFITASLGVECDFCHVEHEFDKDDKEEKQTARKMMQMMFTINQNHFEGEREVTCNTCHRGSPHPAAIPAIVAGNPQPYAMEAVHEHKINPAALPSGAPVFARYLQVLGGQAALDKVSTRVEKATANPPDGHQVPIDIYTKAPDERVSVMHMSKGDSITAYNGSAGWIAFPGRSLREMSASDTEAAKLDAAAFYPGNLEKLFDELKVQGPPEKIDGHEADIVLGTSKGKPPVKFYFDKSSGLLVRMVHYADTPLGLNPTQVDFGDYRNVDGVKTPYRWTIARPSGAFTIQVDKVQQNVPIDDAKFAKPAFVPSSGKQPQAH